MESANNKLARDVVNGGGERSTSASGSLTGSAAEEGAEITGASASHKLKAGFSEIHAIPGFVTSFTAAQDESVSSATLNWITPGYDGSLGAIQTGSSYLIRVASYTVPDSFEYFNANFTVSTAAPVNPAVGAGATGLIPNTTYFAQNWLLDADGNLSYPAVDRATFTTLAKAPVALASTFLSLDVGSATVNWQALRLAPPDVSSASSEGYLLEASSTNFGALTPGGIVYSSMTPAVMLSTLSFSVLPDHLCVPHYFRVASLNWKSVTNYTSLGIGQAPIDYAVVVSTLDLDVGNIDINTSVVISTSLLLSNAACPLTYQLKIDAITPGTPWVAAASPGPDAFTVQALFNTDQPVSGAFTAGNELTGTPVSATATKFAADHTGMSVPVTEERLVWFKLKMPTFTSTELSQQIRVTVIAVPPP